MNGVKEKAEAGGITVIVPCYNAAAYLARCLDSLIAQTMPVEIIVVNDGSTDNTGVLAADYSSQYANVRVVNQKNAGSGLARKAGLAHIRTPYVGFCDADDYMDADMYEKLLRTMEESRADIACCGMTFDWPDKSEEMKQSHLTGEVLTAEQALESLHRRDDVFQYIFNKIYRTELLEDVLFPESIFIGEDYAVTIQLLEKAQRVAILNEPLYHYVQTSSSMSRGGFQPQHRLGYQIYKEESAALKAKHPALRQEIDNYMETEYLAALAAMSRNHEYDREIASEIMRFARENLIGYLRAPYVEIRFKLSAVATAMHYRVMTALYRAVMGRK